VEDNRIHKQRDDLPPPHARRDWASFFALEIDVPEDFLAEREWLSKVIVFPQPAVAAVHSIRQSWKIRAASAECPAPDSPRPSPP
jgi:hypothetical protein